LKRNEILNHMLQLDDVVLKDIAGDLEVGFLVYVHKETGELLTIPEEALDDDPDKMWVEQKRQLKKNRKSYLPFKRLDAQQTFRIMAAFTDTIQDMGFARRLQNALEGHKPFAAFKSIIHNSGDYREQWFRFFSQQNFEWVRVQWRDFIRPFQSVNEQPVDQNATGDSVVIVEIPKELLASQSIVLSCYAVLNRIKDRPEMWTGSEGLDSIHQFISGYWEALVDTGQVKSHSRGTGALDPFTDWIALRLGYAESTAGWANMILAHCLEIPPEEIDWFEFKKKELYSSDHQQSVQLFYTFLDEYRLAVNKYHGR